MKASDYIAEFLFRQGVTCVFEVVGGMITHLIDSLSRSGKTKIVSMHHEQAAAFAAGGYARLSGVPGVALATSGPGAINLLTGVGCCYYDSHPAVFFTGQVNRDEMKGTRDVRQLGFQETDIVSMARPITKGAFLVNDPAELPGVLNKAFQLALEGRPGPVLVDIPMDVQRMEVPDNFPRPASAAVVQPDIKPWIDQLQEDLSRALRPIILAGGGIRSGRAQKEFLKWAEKTGIPVVTSLPGVDVIPFSHPQRVGMIGSYGNRWANLALGKADLVLVMGSRLDIRQTGSEVNSFKEGKEIWHFDCQSGEINNRIKGCKPVLGHLKGVLQALSQVAGWRAHGNLPSWKMEIESLRQAWPDTRELEGIPGINPNVFLHALSRVSHGGRGYFVDVGQNQMWAGQSVEIQAGQRFQTSAGMGSMGFALPAAIGAAFSEPGKPIVVIAGDGGFQMNVQELQTIVQHKLPIKMVILNNKSLGMVRQFQESYFDGRVQSTLWGYSTPDFAKVAGAYGIPGRSLHATEEIDTCLESLWENPAAPFLLEVEISDKASALPKIAFGKPITEMEPFSKPLDMEGT